MPAIRFYIDADLLALAKSLVQARYDVTYPGDPGDRNRNRPACVINAGAKDPDWIPQVAANDWVAITRDRNVARTPAEKAAVQRHGLRMVVLDVRKDPTTWGELSIVTTRWSDIDQLTSATGPRICI